MDAVSITGVIMLVGAAIFIHSMFHGAPFLPARSKAVEDCLDMLDLSPGQRLHELGSGDGRVLLAAARRGIHSVGYEINPLLFAYSWLRTRRYRRLISLEFGSYWDKPLPSADGMYTFLLQPYMARLDTKLTQEIQRPTKLLSMMFTIPDKQPVRQMSGLYLYAYGSADRGEYRKSDDTGSDQRHENSQEQVYK